MGKAGDYGNGSPVCFRAYIGGKQKKTTLAGVRGIAGLSAKDAAEKIGISYNCYRRCESMEVYPDRETQKKICDFYRNSGIFVLEEKVFPESMNKQKPRRARGVAIPESRLVYLSEVDRNVPPFVEVEVGKGVYDAELGEELRKDMEGLEHVERQVIMMRYGLIGGEMSLSQVGRNFDLTRERIRQIEAAAKRKIKLRHGKELSKHLMQGD